MSDVHVGGFQGRRILVVEDDYLIAEELAESLGELGATVVGPAASVAEAKALIARQSVLDAAVLDVNLGPEDAFPVAEALEERGVRFAFATGYDRWVIPSRYATVPRFEKPVDMRALAAFLFP